MRNPFSSASLENFKKSSSEAVRRFPVATLALALWACLVLTGVHEAIPDGCEDVFARLWAAAAVAYFASVAIALFCEWTKISKTRTLAAQLGAVAVAAGFFWVFNTEGGFKNALVFALTFAVLIGFTFFAPYAKSPFAKKPGQDAYYAYFRRVATVFVFSAILWGALSALGNIAIFATGTLFDISHAVTGKMVGDWMVLALVLSTPFFALTSVPAKSTFDASKYVETAFFSFLVKYVAIPFVTLYFVILYAYSAKVLANFSEWPKGEVAWMVIGFSFFGYLAYAFSYGLEKDVSFVKKFRKALPFAIMPQTVMLAYAIYLRLAQYDLTANRYFVVVFGIMLLALSAYFAFSKDKRLVAIPVAIVVFSAAVSVGPWSVFSLPSARQEARLVHTLEIAGMLKDGKVSAPLTPLSKELSVEIYEGADYLVDYAGTETLKDVFPEQYAKAKKDGKVERYALFEILQNEFGIKAKYSWGDYGEDGVTTYRALEFEPAMDVAGYSEIRKFSIWSYDRDSNKTRYDIDSMKLVLVTAGGSEEIDLAPFVAKLAKSQEGNAQSEIPNSALVFETGKHKFVFESFAVKNPKIQDPDKNPRYWSISGYVLTK